jgi:hypothetical protein
MPRTELLPGVTATECPPAVVFDSRGAIRKARRRAIARDVLDVVLLLGVDYLFLKWPETHVPLMGRENSLLFLAAANAIFIGYVWLSRAVPKWSARRVAATWCLAERARFFSANGRQQPAQHRQ